MKPHEIHQYIQSSDKQALSNSTDEDAGESPLLLTTIDLGQWTQVLVVANTDLPTAMRRLEEMHSKLEDLVNQDALDYDEAKGNTSIVECYLRSINCLDSEEPPGEVNGPATNLAGGNNTMSHPLLLNLGIDDSQKAALEDLEEEITTTQHEKAQANMSSGESISIPFMPPRAVEELVASRHHRVWQVGNFNLLAPIPICTWRTWAALTSAELDACNEAALQNKSIIRGIHALVMPFSLSEFDHRRCPSHEVNVQIKVDLETGKTRKDKFLTELWNPSRPYLRCACLRAPTATCPGSILWLDHAVWFMINNLERFFPDERHPNLVTKFSAFCIWLQKAGRLAVKSHVAFLQSRAWMVHAVVKFAAFPDSSLKEDFPDLPGPRKVERLFKPASFTLANPLTPRPAPPPKRARLNLNVADQGASSRQSSTSGNRPYGYRGRSRGRGQYQVRGGRRGGAHSGSYGPRPPTADSPTRQLPSPVTPQTVPAFGSNPRAIKPSPVASSSAAGPSWSRTILSFEDL